MSRMARPFCLPQEDGEEEIVVEGNPPEDGRRPREPQEEAPDESDSPDEDTGQYDQHYQRLEELLFCLYNVFRIALLPPPPIRRRNSNRGSGRGRQQVSAGDREASAAANGEVRGAVPRRRQMAAAAAANAAANAAEVAAQPQEEAESDGEGDGLLLREMAAEARRRGRRRLSSRTVATETEEEPPRGSAGNCQVPSSAVAPAGARRSMSTSSTQCSYEDWAEAGDGADGGGGSIGDGGGGEEEEAEEEEDDVFVASRPGNAHPPPRPPSPPPPSSNPSAPGDSRPSGGGSGSLQSRRQRRKRSGGGSSSSSSGGGRQRGVGKLVGETEEMPKGGARAVREGEEQTVCTPATPVTDVEGDSKMAVPRKAEILRKQRSMEEWDAVSRELRNLTRKYSSKFKQVDEDASKRKKPVIDRGGALAALLTPLLPAASPGLWTVVAVCVGAKVIGRLW